MKIVVIGAGYVGIANALTFAKNHKVIIVDIDENKINKINSGVSPIEDSLANTFIKRFKKNIHASSSLKLSIKSSDLCLLAVPTNFDEVTQSFDTESIMSILKDLQDENYKQNIIIRSTLPIGFTEYASNIFKKLKIAFFPEFLREGNALHDSLYPSRIIAGGEKKNTKKFADLLKTSSKLAKIETLFTSASEAESIKLFSNTFLAMRISFFNELDSFALKNNLDPKIIIQGLSLDYRIGNFYNNPSFGFGGYCLPKDMKQLSANFNKVPHHLIKSIKISNKARKNIIFDEILNATGDTDIIGIYRLSMKLNSENHRDSSIIDIIKKLKKAKRNLIIFEPTIENKTFMNIEIENNLDKFFLKTSYIVANRMSIELENYQKKIFSRDIFNTN